MNSKSDKTVKRLVMIIAAVIVIALVCVLYYFLGVNPRRGQVRLTCSENIDTVLTKKQAQQDMTYIIKHLRSRHPAWLEKNNERVKQVEERYLIECVNFSANPTVMDVWNAAGRMLEPLHDGHTYVDFLEADPLIIDDNSYMKKSYVTKVNGEPVETYIEKYLERESYEVEKYAVKAFFANPICYYSEMKRLGVDVSDGVTYTYIIDGNEIDVHHNFIPISQVNHVKDDSKDNPDTDANEGQWVYYSIDKENDIALFTLLECINDEHYRKTVKEFFEKVSENNIGNVIVDLRDNGGGNSTVGNVFLSYIDVDKYMGWESDVRYGNWLIKNRNISHKNDKKEPQFKGDLYVLTNSRTYSSAMDFTMYIMDNGLGKVVGEASGNVPDSYGDCLYFQTPNSKLKLSVSFKRWYRIDKSKAGQLLEPDYPCEPQYALQHAYEVIKEKK